MSKPRPSTVQACPNTSFLCPSLGNTLSKILQKTAWPRPSFPTNWPFYNIKRTDDSHASASKAQAPGRHAQISPFLEFYLRLLRFWFLTHSKSRQQPSPHCFREGRVLPGFGNRTPASTLNFLFWPMTLSIIAFITIIVISVYFFVYCLLLVVIHQLMHNDWETEEK